MDIISFLKFLKNKIIYLLILGSVLAVFMYYLNNSFLPNYQLNGKIFFSDSAKLSQQSEKITNLYKLYINRVRTTDFMGIFVKTILGYQANQKLLDLYTKKTSISLDYLNSHLRIHRTMDWATVGLDSHDKDFLEFYGMRAEKILSEFFQKRLIDELVVPLEEILNVSSLRNESDNIKAGFEELKGFREIITNSAKVKFVWSVDGPFRLYGNRFIFLTSFLSIFIFGFIWFSVLLIREKINEA